MLALLEILRGKFQPLYALLDAARNPKVLKLLHGSTEEYQSLYEGKEGNELADFAPYLVKLPAESFLLQSLIEEGWGKSWGVYLTCSKPLKELRRHFRHFLMVKLDDGREVYFRFYDPRVLRTYLPACTSDESVGIFGPVESYLIESEIASSALQFKKNSVKAEIVSLKLEASLPQTPSIPQTIRGER